MCDSSRLLIVFIMSTFSPLQLLSTRQKLVAVEGSQLVIIFNIPVKRICRILRNGRRRHRVSISRGDNRLTLPYNKRSLLLCRYQWRLIWGINWPQCEAVIYYRLVLQLKTKDSVPSLFDISSRFKPSRTSSHCIYQFLTLKILHSDHAVLMCALCGSQNKQ